MSKIKVPAGSESEEDPAFGAGKVFFFSLCPHMDEGGLHYKSINPIHEGSNLMI